MQRINMELITQASRRLATGVCTNIYTAVCGGRRRHESGEKLIIHGEGDKTLDSRGEKETATYDTFSKRDALAQIDNKAPEQINAEPEWVKRLGMTDPLGNTHDEVFYSEDEDNDDTFQSEEHTINLGPALST